ncbi:hypothetical protein BTO06_04465 [Tenacibaculum sp. SZ-18]|uniref:LUD domain-containing protein n=1 Tax=Tenacibaculum sp. SZ-18 TaxID=754423 RepID=UPI000C2D2FB3|nr:LUD domain-containing protein [Tenacibaculum sp. SZ-18]AUC14443.1 hypothetical protein BTO06_04465 [Tenacibaculum sp. SZ-18]
MNFLRKFLGSQKVSSKESFIRKQPVKLSLDDLFVNHFINKGGKFLYCTKIEEVIENLQNIVIENNWKTISCNDLDLLKLSKKLDISIHESLKDGYPLFISCEHLIANTGEILFSSNQIGSHKLATLSDNFIVYATTSQLVKNISEGLTGIKTNFRGNIPTNISSIKNYSLAVKDPDDILTYGNITSKNLYLILFEDL